VRRPSCLTFGEGGLLPRLRSEPPRFDTHADEKATQARLLAELDQAVTSFVAQLKGSARGESAVMLIYTELGRRIAANASSATDHGAAAPVFVIGAPVRGSFHGDESNLMNADNCRYST
jgi:uncharacterized protein (DUF1501 family)